MCLLSSSIFGAKFGHCSLSRIWYSIWYASHFGFRQSLLGLIFPPSTCYNSLWWAITGHTPTSLVGSSIGDNVPGDCILYSFHQSTISVAKGWKGWRFKNFLTSCWSERQFNYSLLIQPSTLSRPFKIIVWILPCR